MSDGQTAVRFLQWGLIATGVVLLGFWLGARIHGEVGQRTEMRRFEDARQESPGHPAAPAATHDRTGSVAGELPVDTSLWAEGRIEKYEAGLGQDFDPPLAILRIPAINLEVAVLEGTDEVVLNRGVGHIAGTQRPGDDGNIGVAGHRDGYFRGLKDLEKGDLIEMETLTSTEAYAVTEIFIVDPPDVWVLEPTEAPTITLVTCYPFYFVGSAPQRFIVRAEQVSR